MAHDKDNWIYPFDNVFFGDGWKKASVAKVAIIHIIVVKMLPREDLHLAGHLLAVQASRLLFIKMRYTASYGFPWSYRTLWEAIFMRRQAMEEIAELSSSGKGYGAMRKQSARTGRRQVAEHPGFAKQNA